MEFIIPPTRQHKYVNHDIQIFKITSDCDKKSPSPSFSSSLTSIVEYYCFVHFSIQDSQSCILLNNNPKPFVKETYSPSKTTFLKFIPSDPFCWTRIEAALSSFNLEPHSHDRVMLDLQHEITNTFIALANSVNGGHGPYEQVVRIGVLVNIRRVTKNQTFDPFELVPLTVAMQGLGVKDAELLGGYVSPSCIKKCPRTNVVWEKPREGVIKLNFDGSKQRSGKAAAGYILRDRVNVICMGARPCKSVSVLVAEAIALRDGVKMAKSLGIPRIWIEGDNLSVINAIIGIGRIPGTIIDIVDDVLRDLDAFEEVCISHCFREANQVADFMAFKGYSVASPTIWFESFSKKLDILVMKDSLGYPT